MRYNRQLMQAILHDKIQIAKAVNATVISLDEAPQGLQGFRQGRGQEVRHRSARHVERRGRLTSPALVMIVARYQRCYRAATVILACLAAGLAMPGPAVGPSGATALRRRGAHSGGHEAARIQALALRN